MFCYVDIIFQSRMRILFYVDIIDSGIFPVSCKRILCHVDMVGIVVSLGCKSARAIFFC